MIKLDKMPCRTPLYGTFELTLRCNLHCKMCLFRHADCENAVLRQNELSARQWIDMAAQVANAGTFKLLLTGGEPMLRLDFCEIYEGIYKQGFLIELYTNGTLVTPAIMETLRRYPPHRIGVTLYGASAESYEAVCGNGHAFEQALEGIRQLHTLPSLMNFRMSVIRDNYHDVKAVEELVNREFGRKYTVTQPNILFAAVRGGCADVASCRISPRENLMLINRRTLDYVKSVVGEENYREENVRIERSALSREKEDCRSLEKYSLIGCNAGMDSYTISWDGKLLGCQLLGIFQTDALKDGFAKAWEKYPYEVKMPPLNDKCASCSMIEECQTCPAARLAETGDLGGLPEYVCEQTNILYDMLVD